LAQAALNRRTQSIRASADLFKHAAEIDTLYAEAYSGFSLARALAPYFQPISTQAVASEVTPAARRALELDPTLAQPHIALGLVHMHALEWDQAELELKTAVSIDPRYMEARLQYGRFLVFRDRLDEGLQQFLAARDDEPASALVSSWVSYAYYLDGQLDSAVVENNRAIESDSSNMTTLSFGSLVRLRAGDTAVAQDYVSRMPPAHPMTIYVLSATGDSAVAMQRIRKLEGTQSKPWLIETMRAFALLGARDTIGAIAAFERATDQAENWPTLEAIRDPIYDPVRANERFHALMRRVGLPVSATRPLVHRRDSGGAGADRK
jgi:tetratricopeptide (TPR) repeat protein